MPKNKLFWIIMPVFQIVFGLVVFAVTRNIYIDEQSTTASRISEASPLSTVENSQSLELNSEMMRSLMELDLNAQDPVSISRRADENFENKNFAEAARLYEQLLTFDPRNVDVHNNLGLTLHYLGRSTEALAKLEEGIAIDSTKQRIWLTLGYVSGETGDVDKARSALTTAVQLDPNSRVGVSAAKMLDDLGQ